MTFEWQVLLQDTGAGERYLDWLLSAWGWTLAVSACAWVLACACGALIGVLRTLPGWWRSLGTLWVEGFRNIPLLVQLFLWYHVLPALMPALRELSGFMLVVLALGLFTSARVAEQVRAGIESLPRGQRLAAQALGLRLPQVYRHVLLPQALRLALPPLTSEAMSIIKNSSVAFAVSVSELTLFAMQAQEETSRGVEIYLAVTTLYVISAFVINRLLLALEQRLRLPGATA